ncbi:hypothetical protein CEXT_356091 [Caerostris extrusa]|uniref:Uncharacterized protein n=1 Tax=Caerostris extrusa TaxID=172846 RepID=A0AAV4VSY6_CAEEX|nr:hypothetical protein CEXT_356091 [Caerostris extrusa]
MGIESLLKKRSKGETKQPEIRGKNLSSTENCLVRPKSHLLTHFRFIKTPNNNNKRNKNKKIRRTKTKCVSAVFLDRMIRLAHAQRVSEGC